MTIPYWGDGRPLYVPTDRTTLGLLYWADGTPFPVVAFFTWKKFAWEDDVLTKALFDAQTVVMATADNVPLALTLAEQTILGRVTGGNIAALTATQVLTILDAAPAADWLVNQVF